MHIWEMSAALFVSGKPPEREAFREATFIGQTWQCRPLPGVKATTVPEIFCCISSSCSSLRNLLLHSFKESGQILQPRFICHCLCKVFDSAHIKPLRSIHRLCLPRKNAPSCHHSQPDGRMFPSRPVCRGGSQIHTRCPGSRHLVRAEC